VKRRIKIVKVESGIPGVVLKVEERAKKEDIGTLKKFVPTIKALGPIKVKIRRLEEEIERLKKEAEPYEKPLKEYIIQNPWWRGVTVEEEFDLTFIPRTFWNTEVLKRFLGDSYYLLLREGELTIKIPLPIPGKKGYILPETIVGAIEELLLKLGASLEGVFINIAEKAIEMKEDQIEKLQNEGKLAPLPPDAYTIIVAIHVEPLAEG
jgi:hypothetical protein